MPYTKLRIKEGFYTEDTRSDSGGRWIDGDHMRFVTDVPEKIGGWVPVSSQFLGICRGIATWPTFEADKYAAIGTNLKLYVFYEGTLFDITPIRNGSSVVSPFSAVASSNVITVTIPNHGLTTGDSIWFYNTLSAYNVTINGIYTVTVVDADNFTIIASTTANTTVSNVGGIVGYTTTFTLVDPFTVTSGSKIVTVTQADHGCKVNDFVHFQDASAVGGLNLNGEWQVVTVPDANTYTFLANNNANANVTGGGTVHCLYEINTGAVDAEAGFGYGIAGYGFSTYGTPRPILGPVAEFPRVWTMDIWGDDLIAAPRDGGICYWTHQHGVITNRAVPLPNAPATVKAVAVWPESQIVVAFGATDLSGNDNGMNVRISDIGNPTIWTPNPVTNTAAQFTLTNGNEIIQATKMRGQMLVATDISLYAMYADSQDVFGFRSVAECRIISPNSMVQANGVVFIFGEEQFFLYDGTLRTLKCDVRQKVFYNINLTQVFKVYGAINTAFNEIWWFYPSSTSMENDVYVIYNYQKNIWYFGTLTRTAFIDTGEVLPNPLAAGSDGYLYAHEAGFNDVYLPLVAYLESGDMSIAQRNKFAYIKNIIPDFLDYNKPVKFYFTTRKFPESAPIVSPEITMTPTTLASGSSPYVQGTDVINTRSKGGQISFKIIVDQLDAQFKGGDIEIEIIPTGAK